MTRQRTERGTRRSARVDLYAAGFLIPAPDAPWIACTVVDVSEHGVCLEVGDLAVPKMFGLTFTAAGDVLRVCALIWRRGERIGARYVSVKELRGGAPPPADTDQREAGARRRA